MRIWVGVILFVSVSAQAKLKTLARCSSHPGHAKVLIIKQWHYGPKVMTNPPTAPLPQDQNQREIYLYLRDAIRSKKIATIVAEGCEGEMGADFTPVFNGWSYQQLLPYSQGKDYDIIQTHVPLKLEVQFKDQVKTLCGDDLSLIEKHLKVFSDLRGLAGFWMRLEENKTHPEKEKAYGDVLRDLYKLPASMSAEGLRDFLRQKIQATLLEGQGLVGERNARVVQTIPPNSNKGVAIVIGGLHAKDLRERLDKAGFNCEVMEPDGYGEDEEKLFERLQKLSAATLKH